MFMPNIPRRKIYEKMLEYENIVLEMHILLISEKNFNKYKEKFNLRIQELKNIYKEIKTLFILFLLNKKYETEKEYTEEINFYLNNEKKTDEIIQKNKNISKNFKEIIKELNIELENLKKIKNYDETKKLFEKLDKFNSKIPKLLEIRRDKMKE